MTRLVCGAGGLVYATVGGSQTGAATHVFQKTASAGAWTSIQGNLPNTTVSSLVLDSRTTPATMYVATDPGIYTSNTGGTTWSPYGSALPDVAAVDLQLDATHNTLYSFTHGRGAWSTTIGGATGVSATVSTVTPVNQIVAANGTAAGTITVTLKDASGNPVSGKSVSLAANTGNSGVACQANPCQSNGSGAVAFQVTDGAQETVLYTATDTGDTPNVTIAATATVIFHNGAVGDVNGDGKVDATDALCILRYVAGLGTTFACPLTPAGPMDSIWNLDNAAQIDATDALCVLRHVAALPGTLACPSFVSSGQPAIGDPAEGTGPTEGVGHRA